MGTFVVSLSDVLPRLDKHGPAAAAGSVVLGLAGEH